MLRYLKGVLLIAIFYVPVIKVGTYAIEIEDSSPSKKWIDFTVESEITLNKPTGAVGRSSWLMAQDSRLGALYKSNMMMMK